MHMIDTILCVIVVLLDMAAAQSWAARQDGAGDDRVMALALDSVGNVYVSGYYTSSPLSIYDAFGVNVKTLVNSGSYGGYLVKYAVNGSFLWAAR